MPQWRAAPVRAAVHVEARAGGDMAAYVIFDVEIRDLAQYQEYMRQVKPLIEAAGGRYLVRGGAHKVVEGNWFPRRLVLLEFPSMAVLQDFYLSEAYQALKALRLRSSTAHAVVAVEGMDE
jgi:uncharacterized protein (DUF1330 family)